MRYALAFLFVLLFVSCGGSDAPSGSSAPNSDDSAYHPSDDPNWDANYERAKALCRPIHEEYIARGGHLEYCAKQNLRSCGQSLVLDSEQGRRLDQRDTYKNVARSCTIDLWTRVHGVLFEDGDVSRSFHLFMSVGSIGGGVLQSEDNRDAFTLATLDGLPTLVPCNEDRSSCEARIPNSGERDPIVEVPATAWYACELDERFETLTCGGWSLVIEDAEDGGTPSWGIGGISEYAYRHAIDGEIMHVDGAYGNVVVRATAPDGSVAHYEHFPRTLGDPEFSGIDDAKQGKVYSISFEASSNHLPPFDLPVRPTYFDSRAWVEQAVGRVYQEFPAVPYFGALGVAVGERRDNSRFIIGARRDNKVLSASGEEIGCIYQDGVLLAPDIAPSICPGCAGKWVYIALPPQ